jgi:hypothetical protein
MFSLKRVGVLMLLNKYSLQLSYISICSDQCRQFATLSKEPTTYLRSEKS